MRITKKFMIYFGTTGVMLFMMVLIFIYYGVNPLVKRLEKSNTQGRPDHEVQQELKVEGQVVNALLFLLPSAGLMLILIQLIYVSRNIVSPISKAAEFSNKLARGEFPPRIKNDGKNCDEVSELIKSLNFMRDRMQNSISKLKISHQREKTAREDVERANKLKNNFLTNVSPEFRNPLNSIKGCTELLLIDIDKGRYDDELQEKLHLINRNIERLNRQIANFLDLSRLDNSGKSLNIADFNTAEFMNELVEYNILHFQDRDLAIENYFSPDVPKIIATDRDELFSILSTVIASMTRVSPEGTTVSCGCEATDGLIIFWVSSNCQDDSKHSSLSKMFNEYLSCSAEQLPTIAGSSVLNLLIASNRATNLGAQFNAGEADNGGSEFRIAFIAEDIEIEHILEKTPSSYKASNIRRIMNDNSEQESKILEKYSPPYNIRVLLADHDEENCRLLTSFLEMEGCQVYTVGDGLACLDSLGSNKYDVAVIAKRLPGRDSFEIMEKINKDPELSGMPVIVTSAFMDNFQQQKLLAAGVRKCFLKPFEFKALRNSIIAMALKAREKAQDQ